VGHFFQWPFVREILPAEILSWGILTALGGENQYHSDMNISFAGGGLS